MLQLFALMVLKFSPPLKDGYNVKKIYGNKNKFFHELVFLLLFNLYWIIGPANKEVLTFFLVSNRCDSYN